MLPKSPYVTFWYSFALHSAAIQEGNGGGFSFLKINQTGFLALCVISIKLKLSQVLRMFFCLHLRSKASYIIYNLKTIFPYGVRTEPRHLHPKSSQSIAGSPIPKVRNVRWSSCSVLTQKSNGKTIIASGSRERLALDTVNC